MGENILGYISHNGSFVETACQTQRGLRKTATENKAWVIGYRSSINNMFIQTHRRHKNKWLNLQEWEQKHAGMVEALGIIIEGFRGLMSIPYGTPMDTIYAPKIKTLHGTPRRALISMIELAEVERLRGNAYNNRVTKSKAFTEMMKHCFGLAEFDFTTIRGGSFYPWFPFVGLFIDEVTTALHGNNVDVAVAVTNELREWCRWDFASFDRDESKVYKFLRTGESR